MNCRKCGNLLNENDTICRVCGEPVNMANSYQNFNQNNFNQPNMNNQNQPNINNQNNQPNVPNPNMSNQPNMNNFNQMPNQNPNPNQIPQYMQQQFNAQAQANNVNSPQKPTNNNKMFIIILIILLAIIALLGGFIGYKTFLDKKNDSNISDKKDKQDNKDNKEDKDESDEDKNDSNNQKDQPETNPDKEHTIGNYTFTLPGNLAYSNTNESITAMDNIASPNLVFNIYVENYSYETAKSSISEIITELTSQGFTIDNHGTINYGGREFYAFIVTQGELSGVYFISSIDNDYCAQGFVIGQTENDIDKAFTYLSKILNSIKTIEDFSKPTEYPKYNGLQGLEDFKQTNIATSAKFNLHNQ